jgi:hypothetical protein
MVSEYGLDGINLKNANTILIFESPTYRGPDKYGLILSPNLHCSMSLWAQKGIIFDWNQGFKFVWNSAKKNGFIKNISLDLAVSKCIRIIFFLWNGGFASMSSSSRSWVSFELYSAKDQINRLIVVQGCHHKHKQMHSAAGICNQEMFHLGQRPPNPIHATKGSSATCIIGINLDMGQPSPIMLGSSSTFSPKAQPISSAASTKTCLA